jgi:rSAM/selenodomain-associated transferase 2
MAAPLSVVIAVRNEAARLPLLLADLAAEGPLLREVLVVDGGSSDGSPALARLAGARVLTAAPCRGGQLAAGVAASEAPWLLLLHGDGRLPRGWATLLRHAMAEAEGVKGSDGAGQAWAFRLAIEGGGVGLRLVEAAVTLRCLLRQLPYGDQGLLLQRSLYERVGGMAPLPLMEDLDLVLRLRRQARIRLLPAALQVDGRRWHRLGVWRTTWRNALLRRAWRRGAGTADLAALYYGPAQAEYQNAQRRSIGSSSQPWPS